MKKTLVTFKTTIIVLILGISVGFGQISENPGQLNTKQIEKTSSLDYQKNKGVDLSVVSIELDDIVLAPSIPISVKLRNLGDVAVTEFEIEYTINDELMDEILVSDISINSFGSYICTFPNEWQTIAGNYIITATIISVNGEPDPEQENNTVTKNIAVASNTTQKTPIFEQFTNSYCSPCAYVNSTVFTQAFIETNFDKATVIRYQTNSPGPDLYYIPENGVRLNYYNVTGVPKGYLDGDLVGLTTTEQLQLSLDDQRLQPAYVKINANHDIDDVNEIITLNINLMPYIHSNDYVMHVSIIEKATTGNVGSNGESEFHHVNMKLYPNANGTSLSLIADEAQDFQFEIDMSNTNVEEFSDLEIIVFIQENTYKKIQQSAYSSTEGIYNTTFKVMNDSEPLSGAQITINEETISTNASGMASLDLPNGDYNYTIQKQGYDEYSASLTVQNEAQEIMVSLNATNIANEPVSLNIYPNPTNGLITVEADGKYLVEIVNSCGQITYSQKIDNTTTIDLRNHTSGIYFLTAKSNKHTTTQKIYVK